MLLWENIGKFFKKYKYVSILPLPVLNIISWRNVEIGIYMWILQGNIFKQAILEKLQIMFNNEHNWKFYINVKLATNFHSILQNECFFRLVSDNDCWNYPVLVTIVRKYFKSNDPWKIILVAFIRCIWIWMSCTCLN